MSFSATVSPSQLGPTVARMHADLVTRSRAEAIKALQRAAYLCMTEAVRAIGNVKPYQPVDTGELKRSYRTRLVANGAVLENIAPHAGFMEFGTRPHWAPLSALLPWADRKLRGVLKKGKTRAAAAQALALGTQRKIAKYGTKARGFHAAASLKFPQIVEEQIRFALAKLGGR